MDNDEQRYTADLLREWRVRSEYEALSDLENPSRRLSETAATLSRLEDLSSKSFSEIRESITRVEDVLKLVTAGVNSGLPIGVGANSKSTSERSILKYLILGLDDKGMYNWFSLFSDSPPNDRSEGGERQVRELYFDDFEEMEGVFTSLSTIALKARESEARGEDRQQSFQRAWKEEAISRASRYAMRKIFKGQNPDPETTAQSPLCLRYVIWGVSDHYDTVRGLRIKDLVEGTRERKQTANEVYFENVLTLLQIPTLMNDAVRRANGDNKEFLRLLFEAVMHLRTAGPDASWGLPSLNQDPPKR